MNHTNTVFIRVGFCLVLSLLTTGIAWAQNDMAYIAGPGGYVLVAKIDHCPGTPAGEVEDESGCSASQLDTGTDDIPVPTGLSTSVIEPDDANVTWTAVSNADRYELDWLNPATTLWELAYDGTATAVLAEDLPLGTHWFRVSACEGSLCGGESDSVAAIIGEPNDADLDGVPDYLDTCPGTLLGQTVDAEGCSVTQQDTDEDGIVDFHDLCPNTPNGTQVSAAGCEPTTADTDGDGVTDDLDWCSGTTAGVTVDNRGCAPEQIDSDGDGVNDHLDAYPLQHDTQCPGGA